MVLNGWMTAMTVIMAFSTLLVLGLLALQRRMEKSLLEVRAELPGTGRSATDRSGPRATLTVELSPELDMMLEHIKQVTGDPLDEIVLKAIALYRLSADAHKEGKKIGVLDQNLEFEREVVGFEHHQTQ